MSKSVPTSISEPLGAVFILDAAAEMLSTCRVDSEKDEEEISLICRKLEKIRIRQLKAADSAFSKEINTKN